MEKQNFKSIRIFILPNLFTSLNLFCGYYSITASVQLKFTEAAIAILVGAVFDLLDGKIARATCSTSKFGVEYDSLADLITFGLAPALLMFLWVLESAGRPGWSAAFLFVICGALRLARFNTTDSNSNDFEGLPIPAAGGVCVSLVLLFSRLNIDPEPYKMYVLILMFFLSFCMVSSLHYKSFKNISLFKSTKFHRLVGFILVFVAFVTEPCIILFGMAFTYLFSGLFFLLVSNFLPSSQKDNDEQI